MGGYVRASMPKKKALSQEELEMCKEAFELFDTDKSGMIDGTELKFAMKALGVEPGQKELAEMIHKIDVDGNGTVEYAEFCDLMSGKLDPELSAEEELQKAFAWFDRSNTGRITWKDLKIVAEEMGEKTGPADDPWPLHENEDELKQMIDEIDPTGRGVTFQDFEILMKRQGVF